MIKTQLLKYIKASIEDEYAMEVLYYSIKSAALKNGLAFETATSIVVDGRFLGETIQIGFNNRFQSQIKTVALLLSIRAMMLDKRYLKCCTDDNLIFTSTVIGKFQWVELTTIIRECMDDDEFYRLYGIFEDLYFDESITEESIAELKDGLTVPEFRGLEKYYKSIASSNEGIVDGVICDNAFINEDFETFIVPTDVAYIGNTAFSYCPNLSLIRFTNKVSFGVFPILECKKLSRIVVPTELIDYFKEELPYYKSIVTDNENVPLIEQPYTETIIENNKGKRWTVAEEEKVKHFFGLGHSIKAIANVMGRTEIAIKARLGKLGLINYTYSKDDVADTTAGLTSLEALSSLEADKRTQQEKSNKILESLEETKESIPEEKKTTVTSQSLDLDDDIIRAQSFTATEQYFNFFKSHSIDIQNALRILVLSNNTYAVFAMVRIMGDPKVPQELGWKNVSEGSIKSIKKLITQNYYSKEIYPFLFIALRSGKCPFKKIGKTKIEDLTYETFEKAFLDHLARKEQKENESVLRASKGWLPSSLSHLSKTLSSSSKKDEDNIYDKYEYGLSDW